MMMKQIEKLQAKARQRFGFCASLVIHFLVFVVLAFSGVLALHQPKAEADTVVYFDAGGGGGGGGDAAAAEVETEEAAEQEQEVVEEETLTLPDGRVERKQVVHHVVKKHASVAAKKGSGSGTGGGHGTGNGAGTGSGTGAGSGSGSGGGSGAGHGTGLGDGSGGGIATAPKVPARVSSTSAPYYPPALRDAGIEGRVVVRGVIGVDGRVESAQVVRSSGNSTLDNNALSAFYQWRFSAARNDAGQRVRCYFTQGFPFRLQYK